MLKSPLVGLSEDDLLDLAHGRRERRLWAELRRRADETPAFGRAAGRLTRWGGMARHLPPHAFYQQILSADRGRVSGWSPGSARTARTRSTSSWHRPWTTSGRIRRRCKPSFTRSSPASTEVKRELEGGDIDQVRVMTVHGAKGLQAPIVILPDTVRPPQLRDPVVWMAAASTCRFGRRPAAAPTRSPPAHGPGRGKRWRRSIAASSMSP
ncbi:MAG: hypothetical protein ACMVO3_07965 [Thalassobaculum sp.]